MTSNVPPSCLAIIFALLSSQIYAAGETISISGRGDIHNAAVKKVLPEGILFVCDEGLIKATFDQLPSKYQERFRDEAEHAARHADEVTISIRRANELRTLEIENASARPMGIRIIQCLGNGCYLVSEGYEATTACITDLPNGFVDGDHFEVWGVFTGNYSYTNTLGAKATVRKYRAARYKL